VHLVGFIIKKFVTMQHGHTKVKFSLLYCNPMQFFISFRPISCHPCHLKLYQTTLKSYQNPSRPSHANRTLLCIFKRSAFSSMFKISIAIFSSSNRYSFGLSLTVGFRALLWPHQLAQLGSCSNSICFTYQIFTTFLSHIHLYSMFSRSFHFRHFCTAYLQTCTFQ
jgi:hypothetical protein